MSNQFVGTINIEFDTEEDVDDEKFKKFKKAFEKMVMEEWEMMLFDLASENGFEIDSPFPLNISDEIQPF